MRKIVILSLHLNQGGIEKFISDVANTLCEENEVVVATTYKLLDEPFFKFDKRVKIEYLTSSVPNRSEFSYAIKSKNILNVFREGINAIKILREKKSSMVDYVKNLECDVIITTRKEQSVIVDSYANKNITKIATEHNHHNNDEKYIKEVFKAVKNFDKFVLISSELTKFYSKLFEKEHVQCINIKHFVPTNNLENKPENQVISVGRLSDEKGFVDLLEVAKEMRQTTFNIVGEGSQRNVLENLISENNLKNVILHGALSIDEILYLSKKCYAYAMTSHTESFGLVLIEAFAAGLPCVAYKRAGGACEIISDGIDGYLIDDNDVSDYVIKLNSCKDNFSEISKNALESSKKYSYDKFSNDWNNVVKSKGGIML